MTKSSLNLLNPAASIRLGRRFSALLALLLTFSAPIFAADTNAVLTAWFNAQTNFQTWSADFIQTRSLKTLTQPLTTEGHIWFAKPNNFRWELGRPARTIALRNGNEMFVIYPRLKRAERYPVGAQAKGEWRDALELLQTGFPRDRAEFDARFRVLALTETNSSWMLTLQPKSDFARQMMKEIRVGIATNDFSLTSNELVFADGSTMRNDYTNAVLNPDLRPEIFVWKPEADFKIVEPFGK